MTITFEDWEAEQMKDPEFRAAVGELERAYQEARLWIEGGPTQEQWALETGAIRRWLKSISATS